MSTAMALLFNFSALVFNLLLGAIYFARQKRKTKLVHSLRKILVALIIPFSYILVQYLAEGTNVLIRVFLAIGLAYLIDELVMVIILNVDVHAKWNTQVPHLMLQITASCGLIYIAFFISNAWGWVISVSFWIAGACLIYFLTGRKK